MASNLKTGDKGTIPVQIVRVEDRAGRWVTFKIPGYADPITMYDPAITVTKPVTPTRRKKGTAHQGPPDGDGK